ncbi:MAG: hypothetical protein H6736_08960 [Alphaproteobacteria bacterium]|nr:hypothetical protein [Alphaproteobacteria bacterium]
MMRGPLLLLLSGCVEPTVLTESEYRLLDELRWREPSPDVPPAVQEGNEVWNVPEAAELGRRLYFDRGLSSDGTLSCATCHDVATSGADPRGEPTSRGVDGAPSPRNAPTVFNAALRGQYSWLAGEPSLWVQSGRPLLGFHGMTTETVATHVCDAQDAGYAEVFGDCEGTPPAEVFANVTKAMAAYLQTLESRDSPFDRFMGQDRGSLDPSCLGEEATRGARLFVGVASCNECHNGSTLSDGRSYSIGAGLNGPPSAPDGGLQRFQTPTLRHISETAPYMHDGSLPGLWDVLVYYRDGGAAGSGRAPEIQPLRLDDADLLDLQAFLESLRGAPLPYCWVNDDAYCCTDAGVPRNPTPFGCSERLARPLPDCGGEP